VAESKYKYSIGQTHAELLATTATFPRRNNLPKIRGPEDDGAVGEIGG
jgi:hypothetical protein